MRDLIRLPKADLHVHLEGSMRPRTLKELAAKHGTDLPSGLAGDSFSWRDFDHFVSEYILVCCALQDAADFRRLAYEFCQDEAAQGVRWAEVTFSAVSRALRFGGDWDMPVQSVLEGIADGQRDFGVTVGLVLDAVRDLGPELGERTLDAALKYRDDGVVSFGLGGHENYPPEPFADVFRRAIDGGLHSVPHAGETAGPESIRGALEALGAERIGHGFRVLDDPDLVGELRERRIPLEVCPGSNVATKIFASYADHPLPALLGAGLVVTVNSDDPGLFGCPLVGEYEACRNVYGFDDEGLAALATTGVESSFADENLKASMRRDIAAWLAG